jgi:hypothetical protein
VPDWYPGCKVRLTIRLEDNSRGIYPPPLTKTVPGNGPEAFGPGSPDGVGGDGDFLTIVQDIVPTSCTVELNNYRTADTAKVEFELARLPIDPRLIRAISVQVFGGVFSPEDWAAANGPRGAPGIMIPDLSDSRVSVPDSFGGHTNELFRGFADKIVDSIHDNTVSIECRDLTGEMLDAEIPPNMLADLPGFLRLDEAIQLLLTGDALADKQQDQRLTEEQTQEIGKKRRKLLAELRLEQDVLADAEATDQPEIAGAARAAAAALRVKIAALRGQVEALPPASTRFGMPGFRGTKVVNEVADPNDPDLILELPTLDEIRPKAWVDSRGTTRKGRKKATGNKSKVAFWDFITELVTSAGYICFMRVPKADLQLVATELVISNPRTYYRESVSAGETIPLANSTRVFTLGSNLEELVLERSLKGTAVPSIGVRAYDTARGERYGVIYPPISKDNRPSPTGDGDRTEIKQINLDQISGSSPEDIRARLLLAAKSIYEQLARGDLQVGIKTKALAGIPEFARSGIVGDIFALRPRDPIAIELPAEDPTTGLVSSGLILDETDIGKRVEQGRLAGFDAESSRKLAIAASLESIQREFRTVTHTLTWTADPGGWEISVAAINFLDIRDSINATEAAL